MSPKLSVIEEIEIIKLKKDKFSNSEIMNRYNISISTIKNILKRNGRKHFIANKKYVCNSNYFQDINTEDKAYWLGFLYADGYVRLKDNRSGELKLKLKKLDRYHIELFNKYLSSNYLIKDSISKVKVDDIIHTSECSSLSIYNTKLVKDLFSHGCLNNKSFKIKMPDIPNNLIRHFIRGYFDGDGCISSYKTSEQSINITSGSLLFIENLKEIFNSINMNKNIKIKGTDKYYSLTYGSHSDLITFYKYIYYDSTVYLKRKKYKFDHIISNSFKMGIKYKNTIYNHINDCSRDIKMSTKIISELCNINTSEFNLVKLPIFKIEDIYQEKDK